MNKDTIELLTYIESLKVNNISEAHTLYNNETEAYTKGYRKGFNMAKAIILNYIKTNRE